MSIALLPMPTTSTFWSRNSSAARRSRARAAGGRRSRPGRAGRATSATSLWPFATTSVSTRSRSPPSSSSSQPPPVRGPGVRDTGAEPDPVVQAEALGVVLEVAAHRVAARVVGRAVGHRQLGELGPRPAGDQVQRAVGGGRPVSPGSRRRRSLAPSLEGHRVEPARRQRAQRGQARGAGSDDRHPWSVSGRHRGGHSIRVARRGQPAPSPPLRPAVRARAGATLGAARRRGGVVTQRPAKPFTPVRFRSSPSVGRTPFAPVSCNRRDRV